jgi:hypothetical protein
MAKTVIAEARLRERNQVTIPDTIIRAIAMETGETFVVEYAPSDPDTVLLRRVRHSYAGALRGIYGEPGVYLEQERAAWE